MCYSPPAEFVDPTVKKIDEKSYLNILMRHVFTQNNSLASVEDIIDAKEAEDDL